MERARIGMLVGIGLTALLVALVLFAPVRPASLRFEDADRVADNELAMWRAYYAKQRVTLFYLLVESLREQHGYSWAGATASAFYLARAAARFSDMHGDYDRVLPDLEQGYTRLQQLTSARFDPRAVARAELAWWVARRQPGEDSVENVGRLIGEEYLELYGPRTSVAGAMRAGLLRARAGRLRDQGGANADWPHVSELLHDSYHTLDVALP
jgi:hypothetical protein